MSYIKGNFKKYIFKSDNNFVVGLFKIRDVSSDLELNSKTIIFTGYFTELNDFDLYEFQGKLVNHDKYGLQFNVESYQVLLPSSKDHIIEFLSSELFKGIGEAKAIKVVETLGEDCLEKILEDYSVLFEVPKLTEKQALTIYDSLVNYKSSYDKLIALTKIGFSMKDALKIYGLYGDNTLTILNNPYQMIDDIAEITFLKIEKIREALEIPKDDLKRVGAGIVYIMDNLSFKTGNTYSSYDEITSFSRRLLDVDSEVISQALAELVKDDKVLIDGDKYYLKDMYDSEKYIASQLLNLSTTYNNFDYTNYLEEVEKEFNVEFNEEQKEAITKALNFNISVITGGPGTGKTTIVKAITSIYGKINDLSLSSLNEKVALLAPTGRASKRMSLETPLSSYTIHRFLKWQKESNTFLINEENKSKVSFVIIDEASMLDNNLFYNLLLGLKENCKILLIGDYNQLPSVGAGQILKDIIESDVIPVTYLKKLYRQEESSNINILAHNIINNKLDFEIFNTSDDLTFVECDKTNLLEVLDDFLVTYKDMSIYDFQVLAPIYKGDFGIDNLNFHIQNVLNKKTYSKNELTHNGVTYRENDKVLQLVNILENNVFNGDIGEVINVKNSKNKEIIIDFDNNLVKYSLTGLDNIKLGYAISIHKAQGSEFSVVILPILNSYNIMLYKKIIYTAVTRAKKRLIILGEKSALKKAILTDRDEKRRTSLKNFLTL